MEIGIKVSQKGRDVLSCGDSELLFTSSWPTLEVLFEGEFSPTSINQSIFKHNLSYFPAFLVYAVGDVSELLYTQVYVDDTDLRVGNLFAGPSGLTPIKKLHYYIFNWNLETEYVAPIFSQSITSSGRSNDFGIKISKKNHNVHNASLKDQTLNSSGKMMAIHQAGYGTMIPGTFVDVEIRHSLAYIPMFLTYVDEGELHPSGKPAYYLRRSYEIIDPYTGIPAVDNSTMSSLTIQSYLPGGKYAYLIFKDPAEEL